MSRVLIALLVVLGEVAAFKLPPQDRREAEAGPTSAESRGAAAAAGCNLLLGTHHKTGTTLAASTKRQIRTALSGKCDVQVAMHWGRTFCPSCPHPPVPMDGFPDGFRVVHFVRNPVAAVISGYLYHRDVSGVIKAGDYGATTAKTYVSSAELARHVRANETYSSFLRHVSVEMGLQAELYRFFRIEYEEWAAGLSQCDSRPALCTTVCLEEFGEDYGAAWSKVIGFAGHNLSALPDLADQLSTHDANLHPTAHATSGRVSAEERANMAHHVVTLDRLFYGGRLAALPQKVQACGSPEATERRRSDAAIQGAVDSYS